MRISKPYKWAFALLFISLLIAIAVKIVKKDNKEGVNLEVISLGDLSQRIDDFQLSRFVMERLIWKVRAKTAIVHNEDEDISIDDVEIIYAPQGGAPITLSADRGRYNLDSTNFYAEKVDNDIDIQIGEGITMKGERLEWSEKERKIEIPGRVRMVSEKFVLEGEDLLANVDSGTYEIRKNIRAMVW